MRVDWLCRSVSQTSFTIFTLSKGSGDERNDDGISVSDVNTVHLASLLT